MLQNGTKMEQNDAQMGPRWHPDEPIGLKMASGSSKMDPRRPQDAPKTPKDSPKRIKMAPRDPKVAPR